MARVFFISDLHLGHKNIMKFSPSRFGLNSTTAPPELHDELLVDRWNSTVNRNDVVWVLGDVAFSREKLKLLNLMRGQKKLILGNHDVYGVDEYKKYFSQIYGYLSYKGFWLSHAPVHPNELRGRPNIHGHVHMNTLYDVYHQKDKRYFNVCVEALPNGAPISLEQIRERYGETGTISYFT